MRGVQETTNVERIFPTRLRHSVNQKARVKVPVFRISERLLPCEPEKWINMDQHAFTSKTGAFIQAQAQPQATGPQPNSRGMLGWDGRVGR